MKGEDYVMSYRDNFDVFWSGGPLLPERDSQPDPLWERMELTHGIPIGCLDGARGKTKTRLFNKHRVRSKTRLRGRRLASLGQTTTPTDGPAGDQSECVSDTVRDQAAAVTEPTS